MSVLGVVTQGNPAGTMQSSAGDRPLCSVPAGLQGEAGSPVPTRPPVPELHKLICYLLGLFPTIRRSCLASLPSHLVPCEPHR